jgi:hypothetical protein
MTDANAVPIPPSVEYDLLQLVQDDGKSKLFECILPESGVIVQRFEVDASQKQAIVFGNKWHAQRTLTIILQAGTADFLYVTVSEQGKPLGNEQHHYIGERTVIQIPFGTAYAFSLRGGSQLLIQGVGYEENDEFLCKVL